MPPLPISVLCAPTCCCALTLKSCPLRCAGRQFYLLYLVWCVWKLVGFYQSWLSGVYIILRFIEVSAARNHLVLCASLTVAFQVTAEVCSGHSQ